MRRLLLLLALGLSCAALVLHGLMMGVTSLEFDEMCSHRMVGSGLGQLRDSGYDLFPPDGWCTFDGGTITANPAWALPVFYALVAAILICGTALATGVHHPSSKRSEEAAVSHRRDPYDHDPATAAWIKSPFSGESNGSCVIIARFDNGDVWLGDDKNPDRPHLAFDRAEWAAFVQAVEARDPRFTGA